MTCEIIPRPVVYISKDRTDPEALTLHFSEPMWFEEDAIWED